MKKNSIACEIEKDKDYHHHDNILRENIDGYLFSKQKRFQDKKGIKFFINFDIYQTNPYMTDDRDVIVEANTQLRKGKFVWNIEVLDTKAKLKEYEDIIAGIWAGFNCDYYEAWE